MSAGFVLLEAGSDELPEGVLVARLPSRFINAVEVADMSYFTALKVLDLADNKVSTLSGGSAEARHVRSIMLLF